LMFLNVINVEQKELLNKYIIITKVYYFYILNIYFYILNIF
jgi:hypothetical protein